MTDIQTFEVVTDQSSNTTSSVNHVYVVDVSYSMCRSLPEMRKHLINEMPKVMSPGDTFTLIYFSGKGQCGAILEALSVNSLEDITNIQNSIEKWLRPIGITGFCDPLKLAHDIQVDKLAANGNMNNFVMLTDGYDNCNNRDQIIADTEKLAQCFDKITFIEFGWYCDRELISKMAQVCGGVHVFSEGLIDYKDVYEQSILAAPRKPMVTVPVNKKSKYAMYVEGGRINIVDVKDGKVRVSAGVDKVHSVTPKDVMSMSKEISEDKLYMMLYFAMKKADSKLAWATLGALGDVHFIDLYSDAFSKEDHSNLIDLVEKAAVNEGGEGTYRYLKGKDAFYTPPKDPVTVTEVLSILTNDSSETYLDTNDPLFSYQRGTANRVKADEGEVYPVFKKTPGVLSRINQGALVFNSNRANVSVRVENAGVVTLPENEFGIKKVDSKEVRTYNIVRDGIVVTPVLPLVISEETYHALIALPEERFRSGSKDQLVELVSEDDGRYRVYIDLKQLPLISHWSVESLDKNDLGEIVSNLMYFKGVLKVANEKNKEEKQASKSTMLADKYGEDAAKWLYSIGVRDYGFSPVGTKTEKVGDAVPVKEFQYKVKGLSSLPKVGDIEKKIAEGKELKTVSQQFMAHCIGSYEDMVVGKPFTARDFKMLNHFKREAEVKLAEACYAVVVGNAWMDDNRDPVTVEVPVFKNHDLMLEVTFDVKEKQITI